MTDAAQIRRCTSALRAERPQFRPSFSQPPPARRPNLTISNREPLRLETRVTRRKERIGHHSNRENNACFQITPVPTGPQTLKISNRERIRLEIHLTLRKQRRVRADDSPRRRVRADDSARRNDDHRTNREKTRVFQIAARTRRGAFRAIGAQAQQKLPKRGKSLFSAPPKVFRLEMGPILCFQQVTENFN
jgi:hypothetical protein